METAATASWADFSISRLGELCRLREYCDCYADKMTKQVLQRAIFSVYLDCRRAGLSDRAQQVLKDWARQSPAARFTAAAATS